MSSKNHKYSRILPETKGKAKLSGTQKVIIVVIILAVFVTLVSLAVSIFLSPERLTKSRIEGLASDYYENYLYETMVNSDKNDGNLEAAMSKYTETGFTMITLRQLILRDPAKSADFDESLRENCDIERTTVKFYPKAPFSRKDYRADYRYVCNF